MARSDLDAHFDRIEELVREMSQFVPVSQLGAAPFRADLAGLLVVSIAASYETCVKETLVNFANRHHEAFGNFAANNYKKMNSRIGLGDLHLYTVTFSDDVRDRFKGLLGARKKAIEGRIGKNIESSYSQILEWRHAFAHAGTRSTTIEEAIATHRLSKRVLYSFDEAFNGK